MGMVKTIQKQLSDFLEGGAYGTQAVGDMLTSTAFLPKHNLASEHNFGDLDSSQKKRPNYTMHHHSTVHMLKRNRGPLKKWYQRLTLGEKTELRQQARRDGKELRKKHRSNESRQRSLLYAAATKDTGQKRKRKPVD